MAGHARSAAAEVVDNAVPCQRQAPSCGHARCPARVGAPRTLPHLARLRHRSRSGNTSRDRILQAMYMHVTLGHFHMLARKTCLHFMFISTGSTKLHLLSQLWGSKHCHLRTLD